MTDAHDGNDLTKVRMRYGADGYAIYWYCLELIAGELGAADKITFELKHDAEVIGLNLKIDCAMVEEIMRYMINLGLFEKSGDVVTCLKLAKYLDKKTTRNSLIHQIIDSASNMSMDVTGLSGTNTDKPGPSALDLDVDVDLDRDKEKTKSEPILSASRTTPVFPDAFEDAFNALPKRAGSNPKPKAMKSWNARRKERHDAQAMHDGACRYAAFIRATGKENTEFVMQAATFFGPDLRFTESWAPPPGGSNGTHQQTGKPSLAEQATNARRQFERQESAKRTPDGEPVGTDESRFRP